MDEKELGEGLQKAYPHAVISFGAFLIDHFKAEISSEALHAFIDSPDSHGRQSYRSAAKVLKIWVEIFDEQRVIEDTQKVMLADPHRDLDPNATREERRSADSRRDSTVSPSLDLYEGPFADKYEQACRAFWNYTAQLHRGELNESTLTDFMRATDGHSGDAYASARDAFERVHSALGHERAAKQILFDTSAIEAIMKARASSGYFPQEQRKGCLTALLPVFVGFASLFLSI